MIVSNSGSKFKLMRLRQIQTKSSCQWRYLDHKRLAVVLHKAANLSTRPEQLTVPILRQIIQTNGLLIGKIPVGFFAAPSFLINPRQVQATGIFPPVRCQGSMAQAGVCPGFLSG